MVLRSGAPGGDRPDALSALERVEPPSDVRVLRDDDTALADALAGGWRIAHRSWGARLTRPEDTAPLAELVAVAEAQGYRVAELAPEHDEAVVALEAANRADYPGGPATAPAVRSTESLAADRAAGTRWFGALRDGEVVAVTALRAEQARVETDFTSVAAGHRRRGLAEAVKAASVLALSAGGATVFGTGGAEENAASIAMNRRLGYAVTERWLTLLPPRAGALQQEP